MLTLSAILDAIRLANPTFAIVDIDWKGRPCLRSFEDRNYLHITCQTEDEALQTLQDIKAVSNDDVAVFIFDNKLIFDEGI